MSAATSTQSGGAARFKALTLTPSRVTPGSVASGEVRLDREAGAEGANVTLLGGGVSVPAGVQVKPGQTTATFTVKTQAKTCGTIRAVIGRSQGSARNWVDRVLDDPAATTCLQGR